MLGSEVALQSDSTSQNLVTPTASVALLVDYGDFARFSIVDEVDRDRMQLVVVLSEVFGDREGQLAAITTIDRLPGKRGALALADGGGVRHNTSYEGICETASLRTVKVTTSDSGRGTLGRCRWDMAESGEREGERKRQRAVGQIESGSYRFRNEWLSAANRDFRGKGPPWQHPGRAQIPDMGQISMETGPPGRKWPRQCMTGGTGIALINIFQQGDSAASPIGWKRCCHGMVQITHLANSAH